MTKRTIVVTGANGFIGRVLCAHLEREDARVLRVSRGDALPRADGAYCVHLAGSNDAARAEADETGARREAEELAARVLKAGYDRVVLASSAYVYGDAATPRREDSRRRRWWLTPASSWPLKPCFPRRVTPSRVSPTCTAPASPK